MDFKFGDMKRNREKVLGRVKDNKITLDVVETIHALIPMRYMNAGLLHLDNEIRVLACFIVIDEDNNYSLINMPNMITTEPSEVNEVKLDGVDYFKFTYNPGSKFLLNRSLVESAEFSFNIFKEFIDKGNTPAFLSNTDILDLLNYSIATQILLSIVYREKGNPLTYFRQSSKKEYEVVGLSNIQVGIRSNISRFLGAYLNDSLASLMERSSDETSDLEEILLR